MKTTRIFLAQFYFGFFIVVLLGARPLPAATLTVTNLNDSGPGTLRQAITDAAADDIINFAVTGTITLTNGELFIAKNITIHGPGRTNLTVDPNLTSRAFQITNASVTLSDFTIRNAKPLPESYGGGAVLNHFFGNTTLSNLWISGNQQSDYGNGSAVENRGALTIVQCVFSNNVGMAAAIKNYGRPNDCDFCGILVLINSDVVSNYAPGGAIVGAILNQSYGGVSNKATMTIRDSRILGNSAIGTYGAVLNYDAMLVMSNTVVAGNSSTDDASGALGNRESGTIELNSCCFSNNYARRGAGAIYNFGSPSKIVNCVFTLNSNGGGDGGALYAGSGSLLVSNCSFVANYAVGHGAGIANGGELDIIGTTISSNLSGLSGAGLLNAGIMTLTASTVSGNSGGSFASGIQMFGGALFVTNSTITLNYGGISSFLAILAFLQNSIVAGNGSGDLSGTNFLSGGYNLIGNGDGSGLTNGVNNDQVGTAAVPLDPKLGPLQYNGGTTMTHSLLSGSPAIDSGNNSSLTIDQRGHQRPIDIPTIANASGGDGSDIGAFEVDNLITSVDKVGTNVRVSFITSSNQIYRVENSIVLPATNWTTLSNIVVGTGGVMSVTNFGAALLPKGFYRVRED